jgi:hypothetical protein
MAITLIGAEGSLEASPERSSIRELLACQRELSEQLGYFDL